MNHKSLGLVRLSHSTSWTKQSVVLLFLFYRKNLSEGISPNSPTAKEKSSAVIGKGLGSSTEKIQS